MHHVYLFVFLSVILMSGCGETVDINPDRGYAYFPLQTGQWRVYAVDSIVFDDAPGGNVQDTTRGFVRERVMSSFIDLEGDTAFYIERSFRREATDPWEVVATWSALRDNQNAQKNEGNLRFVKMRFPLRENTKWDATQFVSDNTDVPVGTELIEAYTNWGGEVIALDVAEDIGEFSFDHVATCLQADDDNEIERRYVAEKYAKDIGLVLRTDTILDSRCKRIGELQPCLGQSWSAKGEKGYILHQEIIDFN